MGRVTIDRAFRSKLGGLDSLLEFFDEEGRLLGRFIPAQDRLIYEGVESPASDEELDRRSHEEIGRPLGDILRDLELKQ